MVHATPAVQNGLAFIAGCDSILRAIRVTDGKEVYQIDSGAYTGASPLIDGTRAYFGTFNNEVLAFDLQRGAALALHRSRSPVPLLFLRRAQQRPRRPGRTRQDRPRARREDRESRWTFATRARVDSSPVIAGGRVYVGSSDGKLYVLDAGQREEALRSSMPAPASPTSPAVAAGRLVIGSQDGVVYALG